MAVKTKEKLDQLIRRSRILSLLSILIFLIGFIAAAYYYTEAKNTNIELEKTIKDLEESKGVILEHEQTIVSKDSLIETNNQVMEAIQLLTVLLDYNQEKEYTNKEILVELSKLAEKKEGKIKVKSDDRKDTIAKLFSPNETERKNATDKLLRDYRKDRMLISDIYSNVMEKDKEKVTEPYRESIYEIIYILTKLDGTSLAGNKTQINKFIEEVEKLEKGVGQGTKDKISLIQSKMESS